MGRARAGTAGSDEEKLLTLEAAIAELDRITAELDAFADRLTRLAGRDTDDERTTRSVAD